MLRAQCEEHKDSNVTSLSTICFGLLCDVGDTTSKISPCILKISWMHGVICTPNEFEGLDGLRAAKLLRTVIPMAMLPAWYQKMSTDILRILGHAHWTRMRSERKTRPWVSEEMWYDVPKILLWNSNRTKYWNTCSPLFNPGMKSEPDPPWYRHTSVLQWSQWRWQDCELSWAP